MQSYQMIVLLLIQKKRLGIKIMSAIHINSITFFQIHVEYFLMMLNIFKMHGEQFSHTCQTFLQMHDDF